MNSFNEYGFSEVNGGIVKHVGVYDPVTDTTSTSESAINGLYSLSEEMRDWRKDILQQMTNLHEQTRKKVNEHTTEEVTDAETLITGRIDTHDTNISGKIDEVKTAVDGVKSVASGNTSLLNTIISKLDRL